MLIYSVPPTWAELSDIELFARFDEGHVSWRDAMMARMERFSHDAHTSTWEVLTHRHVELNDAIDRRQNSGALLDREILQAYWATIESVLNVYVDNLRMHGLADTKHESRLGILPLHIVTEVAKLAGYLGVGQLPQSLVGSGRSTEGPDERRCKGIAVAYRLACKIGGAQLPLPGASGRLQHVEIIDAAPNKSLAGWFGVEPRTVRSWTDRVSPVLPWIQVFEPTRAADALAIAAKDAGQLHQAIGRGFKQVESRAKARPSKGGK